MSRAPQDHGPARIESARRLSIALGEQIAAELERLVGAAGVAVKLDAQHLCTQMRGVNEPRVRTATTAWRGCYESDDSLRAEFHSLCRGLCT